MNRLIALLIVIAIAISTIVFPVSQVLAASEAEIKAYSLPGQTGTASINIGAGTIGVTVPFGTNVTAMAATFSTSDNITSIKVGTIDQVSGTTNNNFASPVTYVVTAQDGTTTKNWVVTVTIAPNTTVNSDGGSVSTADLSITITVSPDQIFAGSAFTYNISVNNAGPYAAYPVSVVNNLPSSVMFISSTADGWTMSKDGSALIFIRTASFNVGTTSVITITVQAPEADVSIINYTSVSGGQSDPSSTNNTVSLTNVVTRASTLTPVPAPAPALAPTPMPTPSPSPTPSPTLALKPSPAPSPNTVPAVSPASTITPTTPPAQTLTPSSTPTSNLTTTASPIAPSNGRSQAQVITITSIGVVIVVAILTFLLLSYWRRNRYH